MCSCGSWERSPSVQRSLPGVLPDGESEPTTVPADFVKLETEEARRQAEPTIAISGFGWQPYVEHPHDIAELWGVAAYFGPPEPDVPLLTWSPDRFSIVSGPAS